jgi:FkbM family methyltransferase
MSFDPVYLAVIHLLRLYTLYTPIRRGRWRVATLVHRCADRLRNTASIVMRSRDGRRFEIDPREAQYRMGLLGEGRYEPAESRFVSQHVEPGHVVIDAGANFGWYTTLFSRLVGVGGQVHAFEPVPATSAVLRRNCELNRCRNVAVNTWALGSRSATRAVYLPSAGASGDASMYPEEGRKVEAIACPTTTLDAYYRQEGIVRCDFIKCDVEGAELEFLHGAADVIRRCRPILMLEVNPLCLKRAQVSGSRLLEAVSGSEGYRFYRLGHRGALLRMTPRDANGGTVYFTVLAIPSDSPAIPGGAARP